MSFDHKIAIRISAAAAAALAFAPACSGGGDVGSSGDGGFPSADAGSPSADAGLPPGLPPDAGGSAPGQPDAGAAGTDAGAAGTDAGAPGTMEGGGPPGNNCPPSWTTTPTCGGGSVPPGPAPDFGSHVLIFDPSVTNIQSQVDMVNASMQGDEFDTNGYALLFKPGQYNVGVKVGYYTHVIGLGQSPDDVAITGAVSAHGGLVNFWRTVENFSLTPTAAIDNGVAIWSVSQGTAMRRAHIKGDVHLDDGNSTSGGFIADTAIDGTTSSGSQQQFLTRNDSLGGWQGGNWNMVFVGDMSPPQPSWPQPPLTVVAATPILREKPFLYIDSSGNYLVMVPYLKTAATGTSWASNMPPGSPLSIDRFYVAKPTDTATTINAALAGGKHLILTPGNYKLDSPIHVTAANTVVLGMGLPVLTPTGGNAVVSVDDVDGVSLAGLLIEAGATTTQTLLQVGATGSAADHSKNPTALFDIHCRIGGNIPGTASSCFTINSNNVIIDNSWLWRADHGSGVGWDQNVSDSGIVVNGNDVTAYGLFVEHHEKYQTMWNGNGGAVYMYQSEMPYDATAAWKESPTANGYASYKVADSVTTHLGTGLGVYAFFNAVADNAYETPSATGIVMTHLMTFSNQGGAIHNIINGMGGGGQGTAFSTN